MGREVILAKNYPTERDALCIVSYFLPHHGRRVEGFYVVRKHLRIINQHNACPYGTQPCQHVWNTDVDVNEHAGSFILVTLGCDHGTLTLSPATGLRFISGDTSVWAGEVSFDGVASFYAGLSIANEALGGITYRPNRDWNGNDTLTVAADDRGWSTEVGTTYIAALLCIRYCWLLASGLPPMMLISA